MPNYPPAISRGFGGIQLHAWQQSEGTGSFNNVRDWVSTQLNYVCLVMLCGGMTLHPRWGKNEGGRFLQTNFKRPPRVQPRKHCALLCCSSAQTTASP